VRKGKITASKVRTWDTVSAGAFFPPADLQVPQKEVGQHTRQNMMMPAGGLAHFRVGHAQFGFRFLKTLFNRPSHAT